MLKLLFCALYLITAVNARYKVGVSIIDITGPADSMPFYGYGNLLQISSGIHLRQFARTFIVEDEDGKSAVYVTMETCLSDYFIKKRVLEKLNKDYENTYSSSNVVISATHTQSTPGGYSFYLIPGISSFGVDRKYVEILTEQLYRGIKKAHESKKLAKIYVSSTNVNNATVNRSPTSYLLNPEAERNMFNSDTDNKLVQLKFADVFTSKVFGVFNWFPIQPTSMRGNNTLISSDNVGYAAYSMEQVLNNGAMPGKGEIVAAFGSTNLGDVSPNTGGTICPDGSPCTDLVTSTCYNKLMRCVNYGPGRKDMFESTKITGQILADAAMSILNDTKEEVTGPVRSVGQNFRPEVIRVNYTLPDGKNVSGKGCKSALGDSYAAGTLDNEGSASFYQGMKGEKPTAELPEALTCQLPKEIFIDTGRVNEPMLPLHPHIVATTVLMVGNVVIAGVPGEFTTMAGRRLKYAIRNAITEDGRQIKEVILAGLSDGYTHQVTTYEEYQAQRYEGASTIYGPHTLALYQQQYAKLAKAAVENKTVAEGPKIPDFTHLVIDFNLPIVVEVELFTPWFGSCTIQPNATIHRGSVASAQFIAGHPRNNYMLGDSFLTVEQENGPGAWKTVATDASWETKFNWESYLLAGKATIEWEIGTNAMPGIYRICHKGSHKAVMYAAETYRGCSDSFQVI